MRRVRAVVACRNRLKVTQRCIDAANQAAVIAGVDLVWTIVDDGSTDGTLDWLRSNLRDQHEIIEGDGEMFWAGATRVGMMRALAASDADVLLLNDDTILFEDAFSRLTASLPLDDACVVVGIVVDPDTLSRTYGGFIRFSRWRRLSFRAAPNIPGITVDAMNGNAVLITQAALQQLGPLARGYRHALADFDYALTARRRGVPVVLSSGPVGTCRLNTKTGRWRDRRLPIRERWHLMQHPKGLPFWEWQRFVWRHAGWQAPIYACKPFWTLFRGSE